MSRFSNTTRLPLAALLALIVALSVLLEPSQADADEPVCIPYSVEAICTVDGNRQACELEALPPAAELYLNVNADEAGVVYVATVSATEVIQLVRYELAEGENRLPESGVLEPADGGNFGMVLVTSTGPLDALEPYVGRSLAAGTKENAALKTTMVDLFNAHGVCRTDPPTPPPTSGTSDDFGGAPDPEPNDADEESEGDGLRPPEGTKGGGKVHVEPELLD